MLQFYLPSRLGYLFITCTNKDFTGTIPDFWWFKLSISQVNQKCNQYYVGMQRPCKRTMYKNQFSVQGPTADWSISWGQVHTQVRKTHIGQENSHTEMSSQSGWFPSAAQLPLGLDQAGDHQPWGGTMMTQLPATHLQPAAAPNQQDSWNFSDVHRHYNWFELQSQNTELHSFYSLKIHLNFGKVS